MRLLVTIFFLIVNFPVFAANDPNDEATIDCVQEQLRAQDPQLKGVIFSEDSSVYISSKENFDYEFISDDELQTWVTVIVRDGEYQESTRWINSMFPINIDISSCF